ncbi:MAG TPA: DUF3368 domain-containing protein [Thiolinea sp.]|nr:DUF3368 domain-containing protein [Thiolinea sp.]
MLIVADSSALVALAVCDGLTWLDARFEQVSVPRAVFQECTIEGKPKAAELQVYLHDKVIEINQDMTLITPAGLGIGEVEAMTLYRQLRADALLIDDRRARKVAHLNQLKTIGSLSLVLWAKQHNHISSIRPALAAIQNSGIFLSATVIQEVLALAGE